jgi:hypothetical protein
MTFTEVAEMSEEEPMAADLERMQAEFATQNQGLEELCTSLGALGEIELPVTAADLEAIAEVCDVLLPVAPTNATTGIRC